MLEKRFKDGRLWVKIDNEWVGMAFPGEVQDVLDGHELPLPAGFFNWRRRKKEKAEKEVAQKTILTIGDLRKVMVKTDEMVWKDRMYIYADEAPIIRQIIKYKVHKIKYVENWSDCDDIASIAHGVAQLDKEVRKMAFFRETIAWKKGGEYMVHDLLSIVTPQGHKLLEPHRKPRAYDWPSHVWSLRRAG